MGKNEYRAGELNGEPVIFVKASNKDIEAIVDPDALDDIRDVMWSMSNAGYFQGHLPGAGCVTLHRFLMGAPKGLDIDHINRDPLDNRRENLRATPHSINILNQGLQARNKSGFRGVSKNGRGWIARVGWNWGKKVLGTYKTPEEASKAIEAFLAQVGA